MSTRDPQYAAYLHELQGKWWKRLLPVHVPYRWNLRRLRLGRTLEVGCGLGRNLGFLEGEGVGVDHNSTAIEIARSRGFRAHTVEDFERSEDARPATFDCLLFSHVLEHMTLAEAIDTVTAYTKYLKAESRLVLISPQERGFVEDSTHVEYMDCDKLGVIQRASGFSADRCFSFPFPRWAGRIFRYNEFVSVGSRQRIA